MAEGKIQLLGFRFPKVEMHIPENFPQPEEKVSNAINVTKVIDETNHRKVVVQIDIAVENESKAFHLGLQTKGLFLADADVSEEMFHIFCDQNAPAILFPYARAFLSSITAQAGIPPLILPTINFQASVPPPAAAAAATPSSEKS